MIYAQGAAFWSKVDELLTSAGGEQGLDAFLSELLRVGFDESGELRTEFLGRVPERARPAYLQLVAKYVGK